MRVTGMFELQPLKLLLTDIVLFSEDRTYMNVNILINHPSAINAFNDGSRAGIFQDRSRYVKFLVKCADDKVAIQDVIASRIDQS